MGLTDRVGQSLGEAPVGFVERLIKSGLLKFMLDNSQIPIVDVDPPPVDLQPCSAIEDAAAPTADLGDLAFPSEVPEMGRLETVSVVQREVPVAGRLMGAQRP